MTLAASIGRVDNTLLTTIEILIIAALFGLLVAHEVLRIYSGETAEARMRDLRVFIVPLFQVFALIIYVRAAGLLL